MSYFPDKKWQRHLAGRLEKEFLIGAHVTDPWFSTDLDSWLALFSAICKYESGYNPLTTYEESFTNGKGEKVISTGLFQLSYESARGYGFKNITTLDLKDPLINIDVAVRIMAKWVDRDGTVAGSGISPYRGGARYFSTLRKTGKLKEVLKYYEKIKQK